MKTLLKRDLEEFISLGCVLSAKSKFKEKWDLLIMITACWNVFWLPISIAFGSTNQTSERIDLLVDICFVFDIMIVFRSCYHDEFGNQITDSKLIAIKYLKGKFLADLVSTVPFDSLALLFISKEKA